MSYNPNNPNGQATMANSAPVVLASNQSTVPVSLASMPSTPVTGTFWQATQPVSISGSVAVTGTFWQATQPVSIASMPTTPVTGTFWQATQPVSIASPVTIQGIQDTSTTGTITSAASTIGPLAVTQRNVVTISIKGTYAGVTFIVEASDDGGTSWFPLQCIDNNTGQAGSTWIPGTNASASYDSAIGGYTHLRVRSTAWTSGTATVTITVQSFAYDPVVAAISQPLNIDLAMASVAALNGDLFTLDCRGIRSILLQLTGTFAGTATFQGSNDGTTWVTINAINASTGVVATTATAVGHFAISVRTRYVRARVTTYTSGTWAGVYRLSSSELGPVGTTQAISGTVTVNALPAGTNNIGLVSPAPNTTATLACSAYINGALTTAFVKASAGNVYGMSVFNGSAAVMYLQFYNQTTAPTLGTGVVWFIAVPAGGTVNIPPSAMALANFATGIAIGASTTATGAGTPATAPAVTIFYK